MHDLLPTLCSWVERCEPLALATVIKTSGSSPRPVGSILAVDSRGNSIGSVSAGCVEAHVIERCEAALETGKSELCTFGSALPDEPSIWDIGLSCHGQMEILITRVNPDDAAFKSWLTGATEDTEAIYWQPRKDTDLPVFDTKLDAALHKTHFPVQNPSPDKLLIFGANHIAAPLISFAKTLGMSTYLIDPRDAFTHDERFPDRPHFLMKKWPSDCKDELPLTPRTYTVLLSHDPKLDDDALAFLLESPVAYIGALGSRSTQAQRRESLEANGFSDEQIKRIYGPVGLDIGAQTPAEIATSIIAQIVSAKRGGARWNDSTPSPKSSCASPSSS
ncbi:MAG: XdhC family protein [Opitutales bacterium]